MSCIFCNPFSYYLKISNSYFFNIYEITDNALRYVNSMFIRDHKNTLDISYLPTTNDR